jgi:thioredoxin-related protein
MKIKIAIVCLLLAVGSTQANAQEQPSASSVLEKACEQAKKENKKVFVMFHASWCTWCKKMDNNMKSAALKEMFDKNYVITHLTVQESPKNKHLENPGADAMLKTYKADRSGIPFWVVLDAKGKLLEDSFNAKGENLGCPAQPDEVAEFIRVLKNTSKLNEKELKLIVDTFTIKK